MNRPLWVYAIEIVFIVLMAYVISTIWETVAA